MSLICHGLVAASCWECSDGCQSGGVAGEAAGVGREPHMANGRATIYALCTHATSYQLQQGFWDVGDVTCMLLMLVQGKQCNTVSLLYIYIESGQIR